MTEPRVLETTCVHKNKYFKINRDRFVHPFVNDEFVYHYVVKSPAVVVVPVWQSKLIFVEQYRYTVRARTIEFPIGKTEGEESVQVGAARELQEETGLIATEWTDLGRILEVPGFSSSQGFVYVATGLRKGTPTREASERDIRIVELNLEDALVRVANGMIQDSLTIAALFKYYLTLRNASA